VTHSCEEPGNWHVRFGGGPYGKGPANRGHLAVRPTQLFTITKAADPRPNTARWRPPTAVYGMCLG
jgi:hypothetical protein